jgi:5-methylcytosine-specific restriction protein A
MFYGPELARSFIEVHHIESLSTGTRTVDPITDLIPLCSNCHSMVHREKNRIIPVNELKELIKRCNAKNQDA